MATKKSGKSKQPYLNDSNKTTFSGKAFRPLFPGLGRSRQKGHRRKSAHAAGGETSCRERKASIPHLMVLSQVCVLHVLISETY